VATKKSRPVERFIQRHSPRRLSIVAGRKAFC
jgi:hypothetical protein